MIYLNRTVTIIKVLPLPGIGDILNRTVTIAKVLLLPGDILNRTVTITFASNFYVNGSLQKNA